MIEPVFSARPFLGRLPAGVAEILRCPVCRGALRCGALALECADPGCGERFPLVHGVPILLHEESSLFSRSEFLGASPFLRSRSRAQRLFDRLLPEISQNEAGTANYEVLAGLLRQQGAGARVLVVGGGIPGAGTHRLLSDPGLECVETDVFLGPRTMLVCDAHDLPFADASFDAVVAQAVLEHVCDPWRCVEEMHRVLRAEGLVYAETPFMQQVHGGRYDFTRFTALGHRRLFRRFEGVHSGIVCGPGMALAWSWQYFLVSFSSRRLTRAALLAAARFTGFWLRYFDRYLNHRPGAFDAASAFYFLGRKSPRTLSDREIVSEHRGLA